MLRRLTLAMAVAAASGLAWAEEPPQSLKRDLVSVYKDAVENNADLAAARADFAARQEVVPQARAGLLPAVAPQPVAKAAICVGLGAPRDLHLLRDSGIDEVTLPLTPGALGRVEGGARGDARRHVLGARRRRHLGRDADDGEPLRDE